MQCKDIPEQPILDFLSALPRNRWASWGDSAGEASVAHAMPEGTPEKLQRAKMARLIQRGLVEGCGCGCRGDYRLKGR